MFSWIVKHDSTKLIGKCRNDAYQEFMRPQIQDFTKGITINKGKFIQINHMLSQTQRSIQGSDKILKKIINYKGLISVNRSKL